MQNQLEIFQAFYDLAIAMTADQDLDMNLQLVVDKSREVLKTQAAFIALRDEHSDFVFMKATSGIRTQAFKTVKIPMGKGLGGKVAKTRKGHIVDNYFKDKSLDHLGMLDQLIKDEDLVSGMAAPIQMGTKNIGVLYVFNRQQTVFTPENLDTLTLIGNLAAVEITKNQAAQSLLESQERLFQIIQGSAVPTLVIDNDHRITHWNKACDKIIGVSAGEMIGTCNQWQPFYPEKRPIMADLVVDNNLDDLVNQYYAGKVKESSLIKGTYEAIDFFPHMGTSGTWLFFTAAPLKNPSGKIIGAIETLQDITEQKRAEYKIKLLNSKLKKSNESLKKIAMFDSLTQIFNRGKIESILKEEIERFSRHTGSSLSVFLFDIDDFKNINDRFGHDVGDEALKKLSKTISDNLRQIDYFGRWGGEEFMMILPNTDINEAVQLINRLLRIIDLIKFKQNFKITISGGLSQYLPGDSFDTLVKDVDTKLYDAKRSGKNKFIC